eukprot:gene12774-14085_t
MGLCLDCLSPGRDDSTPDQDERRRKLEEAASKRQAENESRGIKNPERVKRKKQQQEAAEKDALRAGHHGESGLKWTVS